MAIEDAEHPVECLGVMRERFDDLETVLVDLRRQHVLQSLVLLAAVSRGRHHLFEHHAAPRDCTVFKQLVWLSHAEDARAGGGSWPHSDATAAVSLFVLLLLFVSRARRPVADLLLVSSRKLRLLTNVFSLRPSHRVDDSLLLT